MFFRISSPVINKSNYNFWIRQGARRSVKFYRITPAQAELNNYLWENYGLDLRAACLLLIANSKFQKNKNNELFITFPTKKFNDLASIITYGTGKIKGCSILTEAFLRD